MVEYGAGRGRRRRAALTSAGGGPVRFLSARPFVQGGDEAVVHAHGHLIGVYAAVDLDGLLGRVADHPAVRALAQMVFQFLPEPDLHAAVEVLVELAEEILTCNQRNRPLSS